MTHLDVGILAHVDAGKTTLSEALLYEAGAIRRRGRVDSGDAWLDTDAMEKERGITIFSKQAELVLPDGRPVTLVDTPGHADFSAEMERTLGVLDYAILLVSALDGIDGQIPVLWRLLEHYHVPVFLFVNKMDRPGMSRERLYQEIRDRFGTGCVDLSAMFSPSVSGEKLPPALQEEIAVLDDSLMAAYLEQGREVTICDVRRLVRERKLFPVSFGSALKQEGIAELLQLLSICMETPSWPDEFGARVFKITRDGSTRLTWVRLTGGSLHPRETLAALPKDGPGGEPEKREEIGKIDQIRRYSGAKYDLLQEASAGDIVALTGLSGTRAGQGFGTEAGEPERAGLLQPILTSTVLLPDGTDPFTAFRGLRTLEEEEPMLHVVYDAENRTISAQVMGRVQMEILRRMVQDRFGLRISFGPGRILYRETIRGAVEGVGHFEPLRHYAEVHLLIEEGPPGSGIGFGNVCRTDDLAVNWQKQIFSDLEQMDLRGVLTGAELTDVRITLLTGRASVKHTEGGDFREAAGRAVRQGLMSAENILLEPVLSYRLEVPPDCVGRAMNDMTAMHADCTVAETEAERTVLTGRVPAASLGDYAAEVAAYTGGRGVLSTDFDGYEPCHNAEEVIASSGYSPELDTAHPSSSVFCSHGAGTVVPWDEVREYMHVDSGYGSADQTGTAGSGDGTETGDSAGEYANAEAFRAQSLRNRPDTRTFEEREADRRALDSELKEIFERTYGEIRKRTVSESQEYGADSAGSGNTEGSDSGAREISRAGRAGRAGGAGGTGRGAGSGNGSGTALDTGYGKTASGTPHRGRTAPLEEYLLVDGYNIIFAWEELRALAVRDIKSARDRLIDILINYGGMSRAHVILVFDAYKVQGGSGEVYHLPHLDVIYTKVAETADLYIEKAAGELRRRSCRVTVATSDAVEQVILLGSGVLRMSANGFHEEVERANRELREKYLKS